MSYLLIAQEAHTLPYAVDVKEDAIEGALSRVSAMEGEGNIFRPLFLIETGSGEVSRLFRNGEDGWAVSDSAYNKSLGVETPPEYFENYSEGEAK